MLKKIFCFVIVIFLIISMMAGCAPKKRGTFYTLQEAYDQGLLTQDDLKSIAYYQNRGSGDESFEPLPKNPEVLSAKTEKSIKETRAYDLRNRNSNPVEEAKTSGIKITKYYGTYNDCVAVILEGYYAFIIEDKEIIVAGVSFNYSDANRILIWKEK